MNWTDTNARSFPRRPPHRGPLAPRGLRPDWMDEGACKGRTDLFFQGEGANDKLAQAKRICASCPVSAECLAYALQHNERDGVWGGTSVEERERIRRQRRVS